jgi:hypothetical protein
MLQHLWLRCIPLLLLLVPIPTHGHWYAESVYTDTQCHTLAHTRVHEIGRCMYDGKEGYAVYLHSSQAVVRRACSDSQCSMLTLTFHAAHASHATHATHAGANMHNTLTPHHKHKYTPFTTIIIEYKLQLLLFD